MESPPHILFVGEVASMMRLSVSSITRLLRQRRQGVGNFPLPISGTMRGVKGRWLRSDIESYIASQANNAVPPVNPVSPAKRRHEAQSLQRRNELAKAVLAKHAASRRKPK